MILIRLLLKIITIILSPLWWIIRKIIFRIYLWQMDFWWYYTMQNCYGFYPPSFYHTHTKEEIERIKAEDRKLVRELIDQM